MIELLLSIVRRYRLGGADCSLLETLLLAPFLLPSLMLPLYLRS